MKKTVIFVLGSLVLLLVCMNIIRVSTRPIFIWKDEVGTSSILKDITYHMDIATNTNLVKMDMKGGRVTYQLEEMNYQEAKAKAKENDPRVSEKETVLMYMFEKGTAVSEWNRANESNYDECGQEKRSIHSAYLEYHFMTEDVVLETELELYTNDNIDLQEKRCVNLDPDMIYDDYLEWKDLDFERYFREEASVAQLHGVDYFMPLQTASMKGQNYIYQRVEDKKAYTPLVTLPKGRTYEELHAMQEHLVVLSHTDSTFYVTIYDQKGKQVKEHTFVYEDQGRSMKSFNTGSSLIWHDQIHCWVLDEASLNIKTLKLSNTPMKIEDAYEQKGKLYLAVSEDMNGNSKLHMYVFEKNELIYQGSCMLLQKENEEETDLKRVADVVLWGYFKRP